MGFLARVTQRIGRALISFGLGSDGGGPSPVVAPVVGVCVSRAVDINPVITRRAALSPIATVAIAGGVTVSRRAPGAVIATRSLPEC